MGLVRVSLSTQPPTLRLNLLTRLTLVGPRLFSLGESESTGATPEGNRSRFGVSAGVAMMLNHIVTRTARERHRGGHPKVAPPVGGERRNERPEDHPKVGPLVGEGMDVLRRRQCRYLKSGLQAPLLQY